ncbi:MAG: hypothetical protein LBV26_07790 [Bacteroidales bacterium]|nr:hypothetical protein [Bacteroidales bacterium]
MKTKIILLALLVFIAWAAPSCDSGDDCGYCRTVTYDNGFKTQESPETEYCGLDLLTQQTRQDVKIGSQVTKTECR